MAKAKVQTDFENKVMESPTRVPSRKALIMQADIASNTHKGGK